MTAGLLLDLLTAGPRSVAALSEALGVSTAVVGGMLDDLAAEGVQVARTAALCELVDPAGFGPLTLSWRCGRPVRFVDVCGSTNDIAREIVDRGGGGGRPIVVTEEQTAGRGRRGRHWHAAPGLDLTFSLVLRPAVPPEHAARSVLVWAAAMAEALDVRVKWPNDLVAADGRKLGGLLAELELDSEGAGVRRVILGVGLNVNRREFAGLPNATSLSLVRGDEQDRASVLGALVRAVDAVPVGWLATPQGLSLWRSRSDTLGRQVRVTALDGSVIAEGLASDLTDDGALVVGGRVVLTGDVQLIAGQTPAG